MRKRRLTETGKTERAQAAAAEFKYRMWTNRKAGMSFEEKQTKKPHLLGVTWSKRVVSEAVKFPFQMCSIRQRCRLLFQNFNFMLAQAGNFFLTQLRAETVKWKWKITVIVSLGALRQHGSHNDNGDLSLLLRMIVAGKSKRLIHSKTHREITFYFKGQWVIFHHWRPPPSTARITKQRIWNRFLSISQYLWMSESFVFLLWQNTVEASKLLELKWAKLLKLPRLSGYS